jgi:RNA polymerase sigma-70 factor, ECF subfamily
MPLTIHNADAIESLYRQHGAALVLFAAAICGERSGGQDAVHHVFLRLMERGQVEQIADVKAYLFTCVRNAVLNSARLRSRSLATDSEATWFEAPNRDYVAELSLRRGLSALTEDQRQVTVLHIWGELTFAQVAEVLGISANTAASRYRYALAKLREAMTIREDPCAHS